MRNTITVIYLLVFSLFINGCATTDKLETYEPLNITEFPVIEPYNIETGDLEKETEIAISGILDSQVLLNVTDDGDIKIVYTEDEANAVLLYNEQLSKIADLSDIIDGYRSIVFAQAELIKVKDETIKSLQNLVILEQQSRNIYYENFKLADKLYKQEHKLRMRENIIHDIRFFSTVLGVIAVGML